MPDPIMALRLDEEDRALLDACVAVEKLTKSDVLRRALRAYAKHLGVTPARLRRRQGKRSKRSQIERGRST